MLGENVNIFIDGVKLSQKYYTAANTIYTFIKINKGQRIII